MAIITKIIVLAAIAAAIAAGAAVLFRKKVRKKHRKAKKGYEVFAIVAGVVIMVYSLWRYAAGQNPALYLFFALGGAYISLIHIISNRVGRYG